MANSLNTQPITVDTDLASFGSAQTLQSAPFGVRITKLELVAATSTSAGSVSITNPVDSKALYPPIAVGAASAANTVILNDNMQTPLTWKDFAVTGLTATGTRLYIWYKP